MFSLYVKLWLLLTLLFAMVYAAVSAVAHTMGVQNSYIYLGIALFMMLIQYLLGPVLIGWSMRIRYLKRQDNPRLFQIVEQLALSAGIPMPRIGIAGLPIPNAFAFGRTLRDGRVCVTQGILDLLDEEELRAVLGHELTHLKSRDVLFITLLSVIPMVMYHIFLNFTYYRRRDEERSIAPLIGLLAFVFYFVSNLLVLYASRIREYFADRGSVSLGNNPARLASSLYKLANSSRGVSRESLRQSAGFRALFVSDPSQGAREIRQLREIDPEGNGIDRADLARLKSRDIRLGFGERMLEVFSTHPNMLKRIKRLSAYL